MEHFKLFGFKSEGKKLEEKIGYQGMLKKYKANKIASLFAILFPRNGKSVGESCYFLRMNKLTNFLENRIKMVWEKFKFS